jgi:polysaccharide export outer membrane protein
LSQPPPAYQLGPSDKISVVVESHQELSGEHTLSVEGTYAQPLIGTLSVRGMTTSQVEELVKTRLSAFVADLRVSVTLVTARPLKITALGEVKEPGQFTIDRDETVLDVLGRAGGLTEFANDSAIYVVRTRPAERIRFRYQDLTRPDATVGFRLQDGDSILVE